MTMKSEMTKDKLVQETVTDYLRNVLGLESVYAYNEEILGPGGTLVRNSSKRIL